MVPYGYDFLTANNVSSNQWGTSYMRVIKAGVPQGSMLGPLLFFVFINIFEEINLSIRLVADDTSLYIVVDDPLDSAIQINADLSTFEMWVSMWLVTFNSS